MTKLSEVAAKLGLKNPLITVLFPISLAVLSDLLFSS